MNNRKYKEFKPKEIDYIFLTHNHADHCLLCPKLYKEGCKAKVIVTEGSSIVLKDMAEDCAEINERDVLIINSQHDKNYSPLYGLDDVFNMMNYVSEYEYDKKIFIDDELSFMLIPSGHLLGSCQVLLFLTVNNVTKSILITGDIGNKIIENRFVGHYEQVRTCEIKDRQKRTKK